MNRFVAAMLILCGLLWSMASNATTTYQSNFAGVANGTNLNGLQPNIGQAWSVTAGAQTVNNNAVTPTANMQAFGQFTSALSSGTLTLTFNYTNVNCTADGSFDGVSLYAGASEKIFVGCTGAVANQLAYGINGAAANGIAGSGAAGAVTVTYNYSSGAYTIQVPGAAQISGNTGANFAMSQIRIGSGGLNNTTVTVTNFLVDFSLPSSSAAAIPTLSEWMQLMLALMIMTALGWHFRKRENL